MAGLFVREELADSGLVLAAQAGDSAALGMLLGRHRAAMYSVALALLGYRYEAEDAVQEATIVALNRIGDVRNPAAVGPWLRAVVRNICHAQRRRISPLPFAAVGDGATTLGFGDPTDPAEVLDRHIMRDWVWTALEALSPGLRLVTLLRYFTDVTSYEEIAALCGTPVGTVRSRLNQARKKLSEALASSAEQEFADADALQVQHRRLAEDTLALVHYGDKAHAMPDWWLPHGDVLWPSGKRRDIKGLGESLANDMHDGVRHELLNVVASREVVIWEAALHNPPEDPFHCPPKLVWVHFVDQGRVGKVRLYHPRWDSSAR